MTIRILDLFKVTATLMTTILLLEKEIEKTRAQASNKEINYSVWVFSERFFCSLIYSDKKIKKMSERSLKELVNYKQICEFI